jgi:hypothetical protein
VYATKLLEYYSGPSSEATNVGTLFGLLRLILSFVGYPPIRLPPSNYDVRWTMRPTGILACVCSDPTPVISTEITPSPHLAGEGTVIPFRPLIPEPYLHDESPLTNFPHNVNVVLAYHWTRVSLRSLCCMALAEYEFYTIRWPSTKESCQPCTYYC